MPYILYGLNLAAHLALVGLLIFLCFRTKCVRFDPAFPLLTLLMCAETIWL